MEPGAFQRCHPGGMVENSPAFQRWDRDLGVPSPEGTTENHKLIRPFGTQPSIRPYPALKRWAILVCPIGTKTGTYSSNPSQRYLKFGPRITQRGGATTKDKGH